jgi:hypothetical protein
VWNWNSTQELFLGTWVQYGRARIMPVYQQRASLPALQPLQLNQAKAKPRDDLFPA